jgi:hypothetical protein
VSLNLIGLNFLANIDLLSKRKSVIFNANQLKNPMKKKLISFAVVALAIFLIEGCKDEVKVTCTTCTLSLLGTTTTAIFCDDGATVPPSTNKVAYPSGQTKQTSIDSYKLLGAKCQ